MMKRLAVSLKMLDWPSMNDENPDTSKLPFVAIHIDDCPNVFDEDFINMLKIAMDTNKRDYLEYAVSLSAQYNQSEPHEKIAIDHFKEENRPGFRIPFFGKVKFLFTMNHALNDQHDADAFIQRNGVKASKRIVRDMADRAALYSRCLYFDFNTDEATTWGWIASLMIDNDLAKGASPKDIAEILSFMWNHKKNMRETSARAVVNKLWMYMKKGRKGQLYKNRWLRLVK